MGTLGLVSRRSLAPVVPGALAALVLASCGGTKLSGDSIEKLLVQDLARGYPDVKIECPDVDNEVGNAFTCAVSGTDGLATITGSVARDDRVRRDPVR